MKKNFSHTDRSYMFSAAKYTVFSIVLCINMTNLLIVVVSSFGFMRRRKRECGLDFFAEY